MRLLTTVAGLRSYLNKPGRGQSLGLVPTMGALHPGHESLIERAVAENGRVVVSIFVNPLQFSPHEDLKQYPRPLAADLRLCQRLGVDVVFAPSLEAMGMAGDADTGYSSQTTVVVPPTAMTSVLCGATRPGHFVGVATIVVKLLNIVRPELAYFGEKDAQQLAIIRRLVADLHLPVRIRACPTVREASGLALSSRNQYLSASEKESAAVLYRSLQKARQAFEAGERRADRLIDLVAQELATLSQVQTQYVELVEPQTLAPLSEIEGAGLLAIACYLGSTRLIDNIILRQRQAIIAIDGPAGAGKSTVTRRVAEALGWLYLDTGSMYRAITWLVIKSGLDVGEETAIAELAATAKIELGSGGIKINGQDVTQAIRTPEVTAKVSQVAAQAAVREVMVKLQQEYGQRGSIVAEGRDMGTHVFPDAKLKIFLTASPRERARRRLRDWQNQGELQLDIDQLEEEIRQRDYLDSNRPIAPLTKAADAVEVNTDGLTVEQVSEKIISLYC